MANDSIISPKHALDEEEIHFAMKVAGGLAVATSYRRVWPEECADLTAKQIHRKADAKLKEPHIAAYMEQFSKSPKDLAIQTIQEQMLLGDPVAARTSASKVLENEEILGAMSDLERFWYVAAACGAEVETTVGNETVRVSLGELMPKFADATPPPEVLEKTAHSLEEWYEKLTEWEEEISARERALGSN